MYKFLFFASYLLFLFTIYGQKIPDYGNFCHNKIERHAEYPVDEVDRVCQIYYICIDAFSSKNDTCFCNQQASYLITNIEKKSDIRTVMYNYFVSNLNKMNCSVLHSNFDNSFAISVNPTTNYFPIFGPPFPLNNNDANLLEFEAHVDILSKKHRPDTTFLWLIELDSSQYGDFIIQHQEHPTAYFHKGYLVGNFDKGHLIHTKKIDPSKILIFVNSDRNGESCLSYIFSYKFLKKNDRDLTINKIFFSMLITVLGLGFIILLIISISCCCCCYRERIVIKNIKTPLLKQTPY